MTSLMPRPYHAARLPWWGLLLLVLLPVVADAACVRSRAVRRVFQRLHPCPSTGTTTRSCPGYIVDHIIPLCAGGSDTIPNMQWQSVVEAKIKDRQERALCQGHSLCPTP